MSKAAWLTLFLSLTLFSASAVAAQPLPVQITGEADFSDGDEESSRRNAIENGLRKAVRAALEAELGRAVLEEEPAEIQARFINPYQDFIKRHTVVKERKAGNALFVELGVEIDLEKLRQRISTTQLARSTKLRLLLLWSDEEPAGADDASSTPDIHRYLRSSWGPQPEAPPAVRVLEEQLAANGYHVMSLASDKAAWAREALGNREVDKMFLRELAGKMEAPNTLYIRRVHRNLPTPPAAHLRVNRVNHVAFLVSVDEAQSPAMAPLAASVVDLGDTETFQDLPQEWISRILSHLDTSLLTQTTVVTFRGIDSIQSFDAVWKALRAQPEMRDVAPRRIASTTVEFSLRGEMSREQWLAVLKRAMPEAAFDANANGIVGTVKSKSPN
jgi:hypothetical protein